MLEILGVPTVSPSPSLFSFMMNDVHCACTYMSLRMYYYYLPKEVTCNAIIS